MILPLGPEHQVHIELPSLYSKMDEAELVSVNLSGLSGVALVLQQGFRRADGSEVHVACAKGSSTYYVPGVEELIFDRATQIGLSQLGGIQVAVQRDRTAWLSKQFEQDGSFRPERAPATDVTVFRHVFGFTGSEAVVCSVFCRTSKTESECSDVIQSTHLQGSFLPTPSVSWVACVIQTAFGHPVLFLLFAAGLVGFGACAILRRRPKATRFRRTYC